MTFVVLAFNQQDMVNEAIEAAFAQDYPNLQIVLSDDGSSDGTFAIMQAAASAYDGRHTVVVNRTAANRGTLSHLYEAAALSTGELIVVAAGDDISVPHRVSRLVEDWKNTGADALFSAGTVIDAQGKEIDDFPIASNQVMQSFFPRKLAYKISGAMAAYDRSVFEKINLPDEIVYCEDSFMSLFIHYHMGKIVAVPDRLVLYRNHEGSFTNSHDSGRSVEAGELKSKRFNSDNLTILRIFQNVFEAEARSQGVDRDVDMTAIRKMAGYHHYAATWMDIDTAKRIRRVFDFRSPEQLRWTLPRLFGLSAFIRIKRLQQLTRRRR